MHCKARRIKVLSHDFDHFLAHIINLYKCEIDILCGKHSHLVLDFVAIWRSIWIVIAAILYIDIISMSWCISNVEY